MKTRYLMLAAVVLGLAACGPFAKAALEGKAFGEEHPLSECLAESQKRLDTCAAGDDDCMKMAVGFARGCGQVAKKDKGFCAQFPNDIDQAKTFVANQCTAHAMPAACQNVIAAAATRCYKRPGE
ncbi:MAG: hypothetical protein KDI46_07620 [Alphaproteobacteria bacterium]|nr:hypothetical protein [Alphaproteobacteria bacterium]MCB1651902.1 hypothetical protein [Alphaproteobacteria bacterium]